MEFSETRDQEYILDGVKSKQDQKCYSVAKSELAKLNTILWCLTKPS